MKNKTAGPKGKRQRPHNEGLLAVQKQAMKYSEELSTLYHKEKKASKELKEKLESLSLSQKQSLLYAEELRKTYLKEKQEAARLRRALKNIEETYESTLLALVNALDVREHETHNHSQRVMEYTLEMAKKAGIKGKELVDIGRGSLLHDIGKIGSPDSILMKQDDLTKRQWEEIKKHPSIGFRILKGIKFLEGASRIVLTHSEHFDGTGYPQGLKGDAIPIGSRLFAVVDAFDAMTSNRPYRKAMGYEAAKKEIKKYSGTQFDPWAVDIFLSVPRKRWTEISKKVQSAL
jgi:HD-GYP domain-containing protein (c-di-GMP phosphodiesterase class II)